ncbi:type II secretion system F family protein [Massilia brevitalea]|uniref:type II secretion system F family protein n=1 Tax=Massilia brevitalea TaxID=442526 RepID=UPI0027399979|nr:type II secretion system F family protein [Massilia brevitalea]
MNSTVLLSYTVVIALASAVLAWFLIDMGTVTLKRYRTSFTKSAGFRAREFFLFIDPRKLFAVNLASMALVPLLVSILTGSALLAVPVLLMMAFFPRLLYAWMRNRRMRRFEEQLPDALMMLAGGMRAGIGLNAAMAQLVAETPAPLGQEFTLLLREQRLGLQLEQSLSNLARRVPTQTTTLVVSAMRIATETGGGLAETLERTAHTVRSRLQMEGKIGALTAQGKLQAWVVGALPILLMLVLNKMEPEAMSYLWHDRIGWATLAVIAVLEGLGIYVIRRIVAIDV